MTEIRITDIINAERGMHHVVQQTPLQRNEILSERYGCNVYFKREDLQVVRSFKIRGAYHLMQTLDPDEVANGVVCASAGNHAQGVAYSCKRMKVKGIIFMPNTTPKQKIRQVKYFGGEWIEVVLSGDTFDEAYEEAVACCKENNSVFIHPFDDERTITGQGTVGLEMLNQMNETVDYVIVPIGGGGLIAGIGSYIKGVSPATKVIGAEPEGAASMKEALRQNQRVKLAEMDKFVDGAAVQQVGEITFKLCKEVVDDIVKVPTGKVCTTILELYNNDAIVLEPAGALSVAALDFCKEEIRGKNVICVLSGGNNDIERMQEIKERSLIYEGLKHYFVINFPQRAGALRQFLQEVLGPNDDITRFEYTKKNNREDGPALVGIELAKREDYEPLIQRMAKFDPSYIAINHDEKLFNLLI